MGCVEDAIELAWRTEAEVDELARDRGVSSTVLRAAAIADLARHVSTVREAGLDAAIERAMRRLMIRCPPEAAIAELVEAGQLEGRIADRLESLEVLARWVSPMHRPAWAALIDRVTTEDERQGHRWRQ